MTTPGSAPGTAPRSLRPRVAAGGGLGAGVPTSSSTAASAPGDVYAELASLLKRLTEATELSAKQSASVLGTLEVLAHAAVFEKVAKAAERLAFARPGLDVQSVMEICKELRDVSWLTDDELKEAVGLGFGVARPSEN